MPRLHAARVTEDVWTLHRRDPPAVPQTCSAATAPRQPVPGLAPQPRPKTFNQKGHSPHLVPHEKEAFGPRCAPWQLDREQPRLALLSNTPRGHWRGGLRYDPHFLAGNWSFGDTVDGDVSCRGLISLPVFTISADGCLSSPRNRAPHVTSSRSWFEPLNECHRENDCNFTHQASLWHAPRY